MIKRINFSRAFVPCSVLGAIVITFGVFGFFKKGINFGIDFKSGLVNEIRIAPVAVELVYGGSAKATADVSKNSFDIVISGTGAENQTFSYPYHEYETVGKLMQAVNDDKIVSASVKSGADESAYNLFVNSSIPPVLNENPFYLYVKNALVSADDVRKALEAIPDVSVKQVGSEGSEAFQLRAPINKDGESQVVQQKIMSELENTFPKEEIALLRTDFIGSSLSKSMAKKSALLLFFTFLLIWGYAAARFHWDFALGSIVALIHDAMVMLTFIIWTNMEFSTTTLAAILTIVGYSINDTIVILDRVRSNLKTMKVQKFDEILDASLSDMLSRSILTTLTTLFAVFSLYIFTSGEIKDFALALIVGLFAGLYSSLFISSCFISLLRKNWKPEFGIHHSDKGKTGVMDISSGVQI